MLESVAVEKESSIISLKDYIAEQSSEQPYKIVCFYHTGDSSRDVMKDDHLSMMDTMNKGAKAAGIVIHYVDYNGVFLSNKNGTGSISISGFLPI